MRIPEHMDPGFNQEYNRNIWYDGALVFIDYISWSIPFIQTSTKLIQTITSLLASSAAGIIEVMYYWSIFLFNGFYLMEEIGGNEYCLLKRKKQFFKKYFLTINWVPTEILNRSKLRTGLEYV